MCKNCGFCRNGKNYNPDPALQEESTPTISLGKNITALFRKSYFNLDVIGDKKYDLKKC